MNYPKIKYTLDQALEIKRFVEMDYSAIENYHLPIELMMENAGLQLARLSASLIDKNTKIIIGVGNGNNGGGGLVGARRLCAWGYEVYLDLAMEITKVLPSQQLKRAVAFGAQVIETDIDTFCQQHNLTLSNNNSSENNNSSDKSSSFKKTNNYLWVDAYLGFSQVLPLPQNILTSLASANTSNALRLALDLPTGISEQAIDKSRTDNNNKTKSQIFDAQHVLTMAAPKKIFKNLNSSVQLYMADLGIPAAIYEQYGLQQSFFTDAGIVEFELIL